MVHLHWLYFKGPKALDCVSKGASLCGQFRVDREDLVSSAESCNCARCLELAGARSAQP